MSEETTVSPEQKYVRLPDPEWNEEERRGGKVTAKLRLLDYPGVQVFRHWIGEGKSKRPYICPGKKAGCPACRERGIVKLKGGDYQSIYRMDVRRVVNVLELSEEDPKLRIWQYGPSVEKRFSATIERGDKYSDPTAYDITLMKRKTGGATFNVEYDVFVDEMRPLNSTEKALLTQKYDLKTEATPATPEQIEAAMQGQAPEKAQTVTPELKAKVAKALKDQGLTFLDLKIADPDLMTMAKAQEILQEFAS